MTIDLVSHVIFYVNNVIEERKFLIRIAKMKGETKKKKKGQAITLPLAYR